MGLQLVYPAAVDGKRPVSKIRSAAGIFARARRPALAAVATYRLFNLILLAIPALLANRLLDPALAR